MEHTLTAADFQALRGERVRLGADGVELQATVAEVTVKERHGDAQREPFSVVFIADSPENHGQRIYVLEHPSLGETELFLVPLGPKGDGMSYEAIFT